MCLPHWNLVLVLGFKSHSGHVPQLGVFQRILLIYISVSVVQVLHKDGQFLIPKWPLPSD